MARRIKAAKPDPRSRRFLEELIDRELRDPVDRFVAERVEPTADSILGGYRARLSDLLHRRESSDLVAAGALDAVALFRSAIRVAADQLRDDARAELTDAFAFALQIDATEKLNAYLDERIEHAFSAASMAAAEDIRPFLQAVIP